MFNCVPHVLYIISKLNAPPSGMSLVMTSYLCFGLFGISESLDIGSNPALIIRKLSFSKTCFNSNKYS